MSPREKKARDFRSLGHCRRPNCGLCHPDKRWHRKERRQRARAEVVAELMEQAAQGHLSTYIPEAVR